MQARRPPQSPEEIAKKVTDKRPSPVGQPTKVVLAIRVVVPRAVAERLTVRAIRETRKLEAVIEEILERATK
jgi:hypothetical protein